MLIAANKLARKKLRLPARWLAGLLVVSLPVIGVAYQEEDKDSAEQEVVIKREVLKLTDPRTYRVLMHLEAVRALDLTAPVDGYVRTVTAKPGQKLKTQGEAVRLDDARAALVVKRARAKISWPSLKTTPTWWRWLTRASTRPRPSSSWPSSRPISS
jgi:multidrug efflux pump subunit AcrA (membrane-fusion protein)